MSRSITVSPKHGVNPSMGICWFCRKESGEIIMPGLIRPSTAQAMGLRDPDPEAPKRAIWHKEPCATCKERMKTHILFIQARDGEEGQEPRRTGMYAWIPEEKVREKVDPPELRDAILKARCTFMPETDWNQVFASMMVKLPKGDGEWLLEVLGEGGE